MHEIENPTCIKDAALSLTVVIDRATFLSETPLLGNAPHLTCSSIAITLPMISGCRMSRRHLFLTRVPVCAASVVRGWWRAGGH